MKFVIVLVAVILVASVPPSAEAKAKRTRLARLAREASHNKRQGPLQRDGGCDICAKYEEMRQAVVRMMNGFQCEVSQSTPEPIESSYEPHLDSSSDSESWDSDDMIWDSSSVPRSYK
ncbi:uncharacterized protein LOC119720620 [Patiria miniata]|uniref:Uncharacterized protein n=1 Tax=Patiria miniata TaxID=46514 RepID=A0A913Z667_PATMI|nr:uncharacterized protein LOC119720620 [Patiria miniata]